MSGNLGLSTVAVAHEAEAEAEDIVADFFFAEMLCR